MPKPDQAVCNSGYGTLARVNDGLAMQADIYGRVKAFLDWSVGVASKAMLGIAFDFTHAVKLRAAAQR